MLSTSVFDTFPVLKTERCNLRPFKEDDLDLLYEIMSDDITMQYYDLDAFRNTKRAKEILNECLKEIKNRDCLRWCIADLKTNEMIGTCCFVNFDNRSNRASIGYLLRRSLWGKGIMPEVLKAVIKYGFEVLNLNRIQAPVDDARNEKSRKLLEKLGFTYEGILREYDFHHGRNNDVAMYSLLRREYDEMQHLYT